MSVRWRGCHSASLALELVRVTRAFVAQLLISEMHRETLHRCYTLETRKASLANEVANFRQPETGNPAEDRPI